MPVVTITAPRARRRAGLKFGPVPMEVSLGDLSDAQWLLINSDTELKVSPKTEPVDEQTSDNSKFSIEDAFRKLVRDGVEPDKITVSAMASLVGRRVKKTEFEGYVKALAAARKVSVELVKPLVDLMSGETADECKTGDDWDVVKISTAMDRDITVDEICAAQAVLWLQE